MIDFHKGFGVPDKPENPEKENKKAPLSLSRPGEEAEKIEKPLSDMVRAEAFYSNIHEYVQKTLNRVRDGREGDIRPEEILGWGEEILSIITDAVAMDDLIRLVFQHDEYKSNYIYCHSVNVCLLTVKIAQALNFSRKMMRTMTVASLFHDIGMMKIPENVWNTEGRLSPQTNDKIKNHGPYGKEVFDGIPNMDKEVGTIVAQHHERIDGSGYPARLLKEDIHYGARLLALIDRYEAQTHTRLWKPKYLPDKAIQLILDNEGKTYDQHYIKALLKHISIFPVGTWVRISSGETGRVIKTNEETPMRPVIKVFLDRDKRRKEKPMIVDLSRQLLLHAEECVEAAHLKGV